MQNSGPASAAETKKQTTITLVGILVLALTLWPVAGSAVVGTATTQGAAVGFETTGGTALPPGPASTAITEGMSADTEPATQNTAPDNDSAYHFDENSTSTPVHDYRGSRNATFGPSSPGVSADGYTNTTGDWGNGSAFDFGASGTFDGDENVTVPLDFDGRPELTVAGWVKTDDEGNAGGAIFSQRRARNCPLISCGEKGWYLWLSDGNDGETEGELVGVMDNGSNGGKIKAETGTNLEDDTWHHVAMTYNGSQLVVYINGTKAATTPHSGPIETRAIDNFNRTYIGVVDSAGRDEFDGLIDEPFISTRTLDSSEVTTLYETNGVEANLSATTDTDPTSQYQSEETVSWAYNVTNNEPYALNGVSITESISESSTTVTNVEYSTDGGSTWTAGTTTTVDLSAAETQTVEFRGTVGDSASGSLSLSVTVTPPTTYTDPSTSDQTATASVDLADAPSFSSGANLTTIDEDVADSSNSGETVETVLSGEFSDPDGDSFTGIAVDSDNATGSEGTWEYSTDGGNTWYSIGAVSDTAGLLLDNDTVLRFVPATNYNGDPGNLTVHAVDDGSSTTFTSGSTRKTFDTTTDGTASKVSQSGVELSITVTAVNDAPTVSDMALTTVENTDGTVDLAVNASDVDGDSLSFAVTSAPSHGTTDVTSGTLTYTPDAGYNGSDSLTVEVSDGNGGTDTATVSVTVLPPDETDPTADAGGDQSAVLRQQVSFSAAASTDNREISSYSWSFGDGDSATGERVQHTYASSGTYTATLTVTDGGGNTDTDTVTVTVQSLYPEYHGGPQNLGHYPNQTGPTSQPVAAWNVSGGTHAMQSTIVGGTVYTGFNDGNLTAIDAENGTVEWTTDFGTTGSQSGHSWSTPAYDNGTLYAGSDDNNFYAVNASTGDELWNYSTGEMVRSAPTVVDGVVYFGSGETSLSGNLTALNASTGEHMWTYEAAHQIKSNPAVANGIVYVGVYNSGNLTAVDATTGDPIWNASLGSVTESDPTVVDDTVFIGNNDVNGKVFALNATDGTERWSYRLTGNVQAGQAYADGILYATSAEGNLTALNAADGTHVWNYTGSEFRSAPVVVDGTVYVTDFANQTVHAFNATDGTELWQYKSPKSSLFGTPLVWDDWVYFGTISTLEALRANSAPTASNQSATTEVNTAVDVNLAASASDPDGDSLSFAVTSAPSNGTANINSGTLTYTPDTDYSGTDSLTVAVEDGYGGTDTATITLTVGNDPPSLSDMSLTTARDTNGTVDLAANASDPEGDTLSFAVTSAPSDGTTSIDSGNLTYDPNSGFTGTDSLTVEVSDGNGGTDTATVSVTVTAVVPTADAGSDQTTPPGDDVTLDGSGSTDPNDAIVAYRWDYNSDGEVDARGKTVTHEFFAPGDHAVTLTVVDEAGNTDTDTLTVTVENTSGWPMPQANVANIGHSLNGTGPAPPVGTVWTYEPASRYASVTSPAVVGDRLYVATGGSGAVRALDKANGTSEWAFTTDAENEWDQGFYIRPTVEDGTVYVSSANSSVHALDAETGTEDWAYQFDEFAHPNLPVVSDGTVYVPDGDAELYALDAATGTKQWTFDLEANTNDRYARISTDPVVVDDTVYFGASDDNLYAVNASTGTTKWAVNATTDRYGYYTDLTVTGNTIYTATDNTVMARNATDGSSRWSYTTVSDDGDQYHNPGAVYAGMAYASGTLYLGDASGNVTALNATDGTSEWVREFDVRYGGFYEPPVVVNGTVYVLEGGENTVYALDETTGATEWSYSSSSYLRGEPVVADGRLYVGSYGELLALGEQDEPPTAEAGLSIKVPEDADIAFDATNSTDDDGISSYSWTFGDGNTATGATPTHAYNDSGEYTARVTVTDTAGQTASDTVAVTVTENSLLAADGGSNVTADEDTTVTFDASGSRSNEGITSYDWDFDGDDTTDATGENVTHTFADPGTYSVTLTLTDTEGNTATDTVTATIRDTTPPVAEAGSDRTVDEDIPVSFDGSSSSDNAGITLYNWNFDGQETKSGETVTDTFEDPGNYTVTLRAVDDAGNTASDQLNVTVRDTTAPVAKAGSNVTDPANGTVAFDANDSADNDAVASYEWDFTSDDSTDATGTTATYSFSTSGTYTTTLTVTDEAGNTATDTTTVTISGDAVLSADAGGNTTVAEGESVEFNASGTRSSEGGLSYDWDFDDDGTTDATGETATTSFSTVGTQKVNLTVTDTDGNTATDAVWVTVTDATSPTADAGSNRTVDEDTQFTLNATDSTDNDEIASYEWDYRNDGTTDATGSEPTANFSTPGNYTIRLVVTDASGNTDSDTMAVTVQDTTAPSVTGYAVSNPFDTSVKVSFRSSERLASLTANITGAETATLTRSNFSRSPLSNGFRYTTTYNASATGDYTVTLKQATDDASNDGAGGESGTVSIDTTPPAISAFSASNPEDQNVTVSFNATESVSYIAVSISGAESGSLSTANFTETVDGGNYTYTGTYEGATDGTYDATLTDADDSAGNDGATNQTASVTVDTSAPTISSFGVSNPAGQDIEVSFDSDTQLATISVSISGAESGTLTASDFAETDTGGSYTYTATYTGATDGDYTATLDTAEDGAGNDGAGGESATVTVDTTAPTAEAGSDITVDEGDTVSFDGTGSTDNVAIDTYEWDTDDDGTYERSGSQPTDSYTSAGTYTVTLRVTDTSGNTDTDTLTVTVEAVDTTAPTISSFDVSNPTDRDLQVRFDSDEQLATISVSISGTESTTLTASDFAETDTGGSYTYTATYTGATDGDYTVTLDTLEDDSGNDGASGQSETVTVDTTAPSISSFEASNPSGQNITIAVDSGSPLSTINVSISGAETATLTESAFAEADNGDGTYTYEAMYNGSTNGEYTVTLDTAADASGNDGASDQSDTVVVGSAPPQFVSGYISEETPDEIELEFDQAVSLTNGSAGVTVAVNGDPVTITSADNLSSSQSNVTLTIGEEIVGSDTVTVSYDGNSDNLVNDDGIETEAFTASSDNDEFVVGIPSVIAEAVADSYVVEVGTQIELRAGESVVPDGATPIFEWRVGGDLLGSNETTTISFTEPGEHDIELTVTADGESDTDTVSVTVEDSSSPSAKLGTVDPVPIGDSVSFDASNSTDNAEIVEYEWDFGDGTTTAGEDLTEPTHTYDEPGYYTVEVTVADSSGNTATTTRQVLVEGPDATLSTETLSFGEVATTATATRAVDVTNDGTTDLQVTNIELIGADAAAFEGDVNDLTVRPGETRSIPVTFAPDTVGDKSATIELTSNNVESLGPVSLAGSGAESDLTPSQETLSFADVPVGDSATDSVTIENTGDIPVDVNDLGVEGEGFALVGDTALPKTLDPGETLSVTVKFAPTSHGQRSGTLSVAGGASTSVSLGGTGAAASIHVDTPDLVFPTVGADDSISAAVSVSNYGNTELDIENATLLSGDADQFSVEGMPDTVAPDGTKTFTVWFEPTEQGEFTTLLTIESNDPEQETLTRSIEGEAVGANIGVDRRTVDFGNVTVGDSVFMNLTVTNKDSSVTDLTVTETDILGKNPGSFAVVSGAAPFTLAPGEKRTLELKFEPLTAGTKEAQLQILSDAGNAPMFNVWLSNTRTYIIVQDVTNQAANTQTQELTRIAPAQTAADPTINVDGFNLVKGGNHTVNSWSPTLAETPMGIEEWRFTMAQDGEFEMNFDYATTHTMPYDPEGAQPLQYVAFEQVDFDATDLFAESNLTYRVTKDAVPAGTSPGSLGLARYNTTMEQWVDVTADATLIEETEEYYRFEYTPVELTQLVVTGPTGPTPGEVGVQAYELSRASALVDYDTITLDATVGNGLDEQVTTMVPLLIDGEVVAEQEVTLDPGETTTITFEHVFSEPGIVNVSAGDQDPTSVDVFILDVNDDGNGARDLTGDGLRNDVDGDGAFTLRDVQLLFEHREDTLMTQYAELFDFGSDSQETNVTLADVEALFEQYLAADIDKTTAESQKLGVPATTAVVEAQHSIAVTVGNSQDRQITTTVPLLIEGDVVAEREITLAAGETTTVSFEPDLSSGEQVTVEVGSLAQIGVKAVILP